MLYEVITDASICTSPASVASELNQSEPSDAQAAHWGDTSRDDRARSLPPSMSYRYRRQSVSYATNSSPSGEMTYPARNGSTPGNTVASYNFV